MTLNGRNVTLAEIKKFTEPTRKISTKIYTIIPILSAAKYRPMILVSRNIRYIRIFAGLPWGRVKGGQIQL